MPKFKIELTPYVRKLVEMVAESSGRSLTSTLERFLYQVELLAKHNELPKTVGLDFIEATSLLNAQGLGAKHLDPVELAGGEHIDFDVRELETSGRSKTGYAGIQATTSGTFRALVPDIQNGGTKYLASRPTAVRAAIDRYEWFDKYGIPYGNVGAQIADSRKLRPDKTDEEHLVELRDFIANHNPQGLKNPVTLEEVERTLVRHREARGIVVPTVIEDERPRSAETPLIVACAICEAEIEDGEPFAPYGKTDFAHAGCLS